MPVYFPPSHNFSAHPASGATTGCHDRNRGTIFAVSARIRSRWHRTHQTGCFGTSENAGECRGSEKLASFHICPVGDMMCAGPFAASGGPWPMQSVPTRRCTATVQCNSTCYKLANRHTICKSLLHQLPRRLVALLLPCLSRFAVVSLLSSRITRLASLLFS